MLGLQESNLQDCEPAGIMEENSGLYEYNTMHTKSWGKRVPIFAQKHANVKCQ